MGIRRDPDRQPRRDRGARDPRLPGAAASRRSSPHEPDEHGALHAALADGARAVGRYLDGAALVAAGRSGCDAVHPGYGYLAENPDFAEAVQRAGLIWIGPPPHAMRLLGDKIEARRLAEAAGVAGRARLCRGRCWTTTRSLAEAERLGTPLLVKAAAGGGGRGMRAVDDLDDLAEALAAARREAEAAFGDDRVFLERRLRRRAPRRGADAGRRPRARRPPRRARLLDAAPPPEDPRGVALAGRRRRAALAAGRGRTRGRPRRPATPAPAPSSSCSTPTAAGASSS